MTKKDTLSTQKGGVLSKQAIYERLSRLTPKAIEKLEEMLNSRNENIRLGAINKILDKCIPDLKATEVTGESGGAVLVRLITEDDAKSNSGSTNQELPGSADNL